jgi:enoyl-CoA hydratase/carnithine racemase
MSERAIASTEAASDFREFAATTAGGLIEAEAVELTESGVVAAVLWLNRPDALNPLGHASMLALGEALRAADADERVCAVLITGRGRAFSAGGDLKAYVEMQHDPVGWSRFMDDFIGVCTSIHEIRKPVVALVNGVCVAGGLELLVACDFAYAAESARIGDGHLTYGQIGGGGSLAHLPRLIGPARASELLFSARLLSAHQACEWGLVNRVFSDDELLAAGLEFAAGVAEKSPAGVARMKYAMRSGYDEGTGFEAALRLERETASLYVLTLPDSAEGLAAFSEKRKPRFPGR